MSFERIEFSWGSALYQVISVGKDSNEPEINARHEIDDRIAIQVRVPDRPQAPTLSSSGIGAVSGSMTFTVPVPANNGAPIASYIWQGYTNAALTTGFWETTTTTNQLTFAVTAGESYWVRVKAVNSAGESPVSAAGTATATPPLQAPSVPATPTLTSKDATSVTITAAGSGGGAATRWRWRYSTDATISDSDPFVTSSSNSVIISGLVSDTAYWIDVRAENDAGNSAYSGDLSVRTGVSRSVTYSDTAPDQGDVVTTDVANYLAVWWEWQSIGSTAWNRLSDNDGDARPSGTSLTIRSSSRYRYRICWRTSSGDYCADAYITAN